MAMQDKNNKKIKYRKVKPSGHFEIFEAIRYLEYEANKAGLFDLSSILHDISEKKDMRCICIEDNTLTGKFHDGRYDITELLEISQKLSAKAAEINQLALDVASRVEK